jgi:hypothetical protein
VVNIANLVGKVVLHDSVYHFVDSGVTRPIFFIQDCAVRETIDLLRAIVKPDNFGSRLVDPKGDRLQSVAGVPPNDPHTLSPPLGGRLGKDDMTHAQTCL